MSHFHGKSRITSLHQRLTTACEYTLISAIICLSVASLIGVNAYFALARVEAAYQLERV